MTQQMMRNGQGETAESVMLHGTTPPLSAELGGLREKRISTRPYRPRDNRIVQWVSPNQALDGIDAPGKHQQKEGGKRPIQVKKAYIWQFLRFCIVGTSNTVLDFLVLNVLLWALPTTDTWRVLGYNSLAVILGATNSFFWNKYWTFQQRDPITFQELYRFIVVASGTTLMNDTLMWLLGRAFPGIMNSSLVGTNVLKLGAILGTMSISFFGMRLWVFLQKRSAGGAQSMADDATKRLPGIKLVYDIETVISAALKPAFEMDTIKADAPSKSKSSLPAADALLARDSLNKSRRAMKTLIIIPTYNEVENLPLLLEQIFLYTPATDVLIVDDNSQDGTGKLAEELKQGNHRIHVLHRPGKLGLGTAYIAGFKYAIQHGYDAAFEMDADFSHDPRYLPDFLKAIEHADLVIGSRYIPGGSTPNWSLVRRLISGGGNIFARFVLGIPVHDCTGGFRCYRRQVLQSIDLDAIQSRGYAFQVELTYRVLEQGFNIVETPITFLDRRLGKSKMSRKIFIEAFTWVVRTRLRKQRVTYAPTRQQSNDQTSGTTSQNAEEERSSVTSVPLGRASLSTIRPVKLVRECPPENHTTRVDK